jgi:hypothetical protein
VVAVHLQPLLLPLSRPLLSPGLLLLPFSLPFPPVLLLLQLLLLLLLLALVVVVIVVVVVVVVAQAC